MSVSEYLSILEISEKDKYNFSAIKNGFTKKARIINNTTEDRVKYNLAYEYLLNCIHTVKKNEQETILMEAIYKGDLQTLKALFKKFPDLVNYRKNESNYPLVYYATRSGHYGILEFVLQSGCDLDFSKDRSTPMHCAAYYGYDHLIPLLFKYGVPTNAKNVYGNIPEQESYRQQITLLLKSAHKDFFYQLIQQLADKKIAIGCLNLNFKKTQTKSNQQKQYDVRKIILKDYFDNHQDCVDVFHGTKFESLESIAIHGLKKPGDKINDKTIKIVDGHIPDNNTVRGIPNWGKAIFVSPSIYYAGDRCYSKRILIDKIDYCPIVQVKLKKYTYTFHSHTFAKYDHKFGEPIQLEYRVESGGEIYRSTSEKDVKVIAILFVRCGFLSQNPDFKEVTDFILNSQQEKTFKLKGQMESLKI